MEIETSHPFMAALQPLSVGQDALNDVVQEAARVSVALEEEEEYPILEEVGAGGGQAVAGWSSQAATATSVVADSGNDKLGISNTGVSRRSSRYSTSNVKSEEVEVITCQET